MNNNMDINRYRIALRKDKTPLYSFKDLLDYPLDNNIISRFQDLFEANYSSNYGIVCGGKHSNLIIIDLDVSYCNGGFNRKSIYDFELMCKDNDYDLLKNTKVVVTGSKGYHIYFDYVEGIKSGGYDKIDIISDGKYIVGEGSVYAGCKGQGEGKAKCKNCFEYTIPCLNKDALYKVVNPDVKVGIMPEFIRDWIKSLRNEPTKITIEEEGEASGGTEDEKKIGDCCDINIKAMEGLLTKFKKYSKEYGSWIQFLYFLKNVCCSMDCYTYYAVFFSKLYMSKYDDKAMKTIESLVKNPDGYSWSWIRGLLPKTSNDLVINDIIRWVSGFMKVKRVNDSNEPLKCIEWNKGNFTIDYTLGHFTKHLNNTVFDSFVDAFTYLAENLPKVIIILSKDNLYILNNRGVRDITKVFPENITIYYKEYDADGREFIKKQFLSKMMKTYTDVKRCFPIFENIACIPNPAEQSEFIYNTFEGLKCDGSLSDRQYDSPDFTPILDHIYKILCDKNKIIYWWLISWFGQIFSKPWEKTQKGILLFGEEGAGKNTIMDFVKDKIIGRKHGMATAGLKDFSGFNSPIMDRIFVIVNECGYKEGFDEGIIGLYKTCVTDPTMTFNMKNVKQFVDYPCLLNIVIITNNHLVMRLSNGERRTVVLKASSERIGDVKYFKVLHSCINSEINSHRFFTYCAELEFREPENWVDVISTTPPMTDIKRDMIFDSQNSVMKFVQEIIQEDILLEEMVDEEDMIDSKTILKKALYSAYRLYCGDSNIKVICLPEFYRFIQSCRGVEKRMSNRKRYFDLTKLYIKGVSPPTL